MAIQFARIKIVGRSSGGNACRSGAYNARSIVRDERTNVVYNFTNKKDNVYHRMLLPDHVDNKYQDLNELHNAVECIERKKNSQLLKEIIIALPDDKELNLQDRINITHQIIDKKAWVKNGLAVQVDIHEPHEGENNWHVHLLLTTRRFTEDGKKFEKHKARDLNPDFVNKEGGKGFIQKEEKMISEDVRDIINDYFKSLGLTNRVDAISETPGEHIGPVRMRSILNEVIVRNEEKALLNKVSFQTGEDVLSSVTKTASVFNKNDLRRAVKHIDNKEHRNWLINQALQSKEIEYLHDDSGARIGFYTTKTVKAEELKLMRLANYIHKEKNPIRDLISIYRRNDLETIINQVVQDNQGKRILTDEQYRALEHILLAESGLRIMRGRAGSGKSRVLGSFASICKASGMHVIGVAPTHKARGILSSLGYEQNDTIKGMLFKYMNGRFYVPKGSVIVVDEAGMVGNEDYMELKRLATSRKCNLILAGDERQLTSVQRGGMFEVMSEVYGSCSILDIKRQEARWGREVAKLMSDGKVGNAVSILQEKGKIINSADKISQIDRLLSDWNNLSAPLEDKLIIAITNKDVNLLNCGAREYLKAKGMLIGKTIKVDEKKYNKGERILITRTNKAIGVRNGDFAKIISISKNAFTLQLNGIDQDIGEMNGKIVKINPQEFSGFTYGYATTIYKAQGASIPYIFILHDGFSGLRNSYVSLTRNVKDVNLYTNQQSTKNKEQLISQLAADPEVSSSLYYYTTEDINLHKMSEYDNANKGILSKFFDNVSANIKIKFREFTDKRIVSHKYYNYQEPKLAQAQVEEVLEHQEKAYGTYANFANGTKLSNHSSHFADNSESFNDNVDRYFAIVEKQSQKLTAQDLFYAKFERSKQSNTQDKVKSAKENNHISSNHDYEAQKVAWQQDYQRLKSEISFKAEQIVTDLLGTPNKRLSNGRTLRFGKSGKVAVRIQGSRAGHWYDFSEDKGGDLFKLVQKRQGVNFKGSVEYLKGAVGFRDTIAVNKHNLRLVETQQNNDKLLTKAKAQEEEKQRNITRTEYTNKIINKASDIEVNSVALKYLENRAIEPRTIKNADLKTAKIFVRDNNKNGHYYENLIGFARDAQGKITGGQQIFLSKEGYKADLDVPKRSFGSISGSFVDLGFVGSEDKNTAKNITIITEGIETGLSVKQSLLKNHKSHEGLSFKIICALGISNIKNYTSTKGANIIIAADNDGQDTNTSKLTKDSITTLEQQSATVHITIPKVEGDFNDILQGKLSEHNSNHNPEYIIYETLKPAINKHLARTIESYIKADGKSLDQYLDKEDIDNLSYIREKQDHLGKYINNQEIINIFHSNKLRGSIYLDDLRKTLEEKEIEYLEVKEVSNKIGAFEEVRNNSKDITATLNGIAKEQKYLSGLHNKLTSEDHDKRVCSLVNKAYQNQQDKVFEELKKVVSYIQSNKVKDDKELLSILKSDKNNSDISKLYNKLDKSCEEHEIKATIDKLEKHTQFQKTPQQLMQSLEKEQEYLSSLHNNLRHHDHDNKLLYKIKAAQHNIESGKLDDIYHTAHYTTKSNILSQKSLAGHLKCSHNLEIIDKRINDICYKHHCKTLTKHCNQMDEGKVIHHNGTKFDNHIKYLEHWKENVDHKLLPIKQMNKIIQEHIQMQQSLNKSKSMDM